MHPGPDRELLLDLLVERTSGSLSDSEVARLEGLLAAADEPIGEDYFDHAAAALSVVFGASFGGNDPMPAELRARCASAYSSQVRGTPVGESEAGELEVEEAAPEPMPVAESMPPRPIRFTAETSSAGRASSSRGWLVAASLALIAAAGWWQAFGGGASGGGSAEQAGSVIAARDALVERGVAELAWSPWGEQAEQELTDVDGSVVWDQSSQEGYMTFRGLPANDPESMRYQLWIVDTARGEPLAVPPVDGGVFDVPAGGGEVVVPIRAKLAVGNAAVFAVTREGPLGAVVSERRPEQLVVIASAG